MSTDNDAGRLVGVTKSLTATGLRRADSAGLVLMDPHPTKAQLMNSPLRAPLSL